MAFVKIVSILATLFVILLVTHTISCDELETYRPDELYIVNPDTFPMILTESSDPLTRGDRSNLVCTATICQRICWALDYRFGRCNINRICVCSNF